MALRSFAVLSTLAAAVLAQSSNPLIPPGISSSCSTYLTALDNDSSILSCTQPFTTALAAFSPGANATSLSAAAITSALQTLCGASAFTACPQSTVTAQLSAFYAACQVELTSSPNQAVKTTYDSLYASVPLRSVICAKDDSGNYCATKLSNASSTGTTPPVDPGTSDVQALLQDYLYIPASTSAAPARRDVSNTTTVYLPNTTTYQDTNLLFMFLYPSMSSSQLCTTCTKNILTPYISFESTLPYASGINSSLLLSGQTDLYNNVTSTCGASFLGGAVQAAGGLSGGLVSGAAPRVGSHELSAAASAILGVAALVAASL